MSVTIEQIKNNAQVNNMCDYFEYNWPEMDTFWRIVAVSNNELELINNDGTMHTVTFNELAIAINEYRAMLYDNENEELF